MVFGLLEFIEQVQAFIKALLKSLSCASAMLYLAGTIVAGFLGSSGDKLS